MNRNPTIHGLWRNSTDPSELIAAVRTEARDAGYRRMDAYAPLPIEELSDALGSTIRAFRLSCSAAGFSAARGAFCCNTMARCLAIRFNIGGRPFNSWPAFIPVTFEMTILFAALAAVFGMLAPQRLAHALSPAISRPPFRAGHARRLFPLVSETRDPNYRSGADGQFLPALNPREADGGACMNRTNQQQLLAALIVCIAAVIGCQQKMGKQPAYRPLEPSEFFGRRPIGSGRSCPAPWLAGICKPTWLFFTGAASEAGSGNCFGSRWRREAGARCDR